MRKHVTTVSYPPDEKLLDWIDRQHARARKGKLDRFRVLLHTPDLIPAPLLAFQYFEECRLCWLSGAFVATIAMAQIAFEELLRDRYRAEKGFGGMLNPDVTVDFAGFKELIQQAEIENVITRKEAAALHRLRVMRKTYAHTKSPKEPALSAMEYVYRQAEKFVENKGKIRVKEEAQRATELLLSIFPRLCCRWLGQAMKSVTRHQP
jgi:hypothetical protein